MQILYQSSVEISYTYTRQPLKTHFIIAGLTRNPPEINEWDCASSAQ